MRRYAGSVDNRTVDALEAGVIDDEDQEAIDERLTRARSGDERLIAKTKCGGCATLENIARMDAKRR